MSQLVRQRIKYLMEFGEMYPREEPATKNFVIRWFSLILIVSLIDLGLMLYHWWSRL